MECATPLLSTIPRRLAAVLAGLFMLLLAGCGTLTAGYPPAAGGGEPSADSPGRRAAARAGQVEAQAAFTAGEQAFLDEAYQEAVEAYGRALEHDPELSGAWVGRARARGKLGDHQAALADWDRAVELRPEDAAVLGDRAECLWRLNEYERAIEELDRALSVVPADDNWTLAWLHALRGDSLRLLDRHDEADPELSEAIERMPDYTFALARRGENRRMLDRLDEALQDLDRAVELQPEDSYAYASRGQTYHQLGRLTEALEDLDKALELQPDYPWASERREEVVAALEAPEEEGSADVPVANVPAAGGSKTDGATGGRAAPPAPATRPLVAVMDFQVENLAASEGRLIVDLLSSALASRQVFRVLERSQRDAILKEIEFSVSGCAEESCQLKAGRLLAADRIVVGSLGRVGGRYILNAKLLQVETGEVAATAYQVFKSLDELVDGCEEVAFSLSGI